MSKPFDILDLKKDMPTIEEAREVLNNYLTTAKKQGIKVFKIIHGYGSSGVGGALRVALRKSLAKRKKEKKITSFVTGEDWAFLDENTQKIIQACPELKSDEDLDKYNEGITFVLL